MTATAALLMSLESITHETSRMLLALDRAASLSSPPDRREAKRRVLEIRAQAQELFAWLHEVRLEEPRN